MDAEGKLARGATHNFHVSPSRAAASIRCRLRSPASTRDHPLRPALPERDALQRVFREIRHRVRDYSCRRAILVGHNAAFDLGFLNAAVARAEVKRNPFHPFSCFDTATLAGAALGQTVLAKAVRVAGFEWDPGSAHSARYDAERSADLFCLVCNRLRDSHQAASERARSFGWLTEAAGPDEAEAEVTPL